MTTMMTSPRSGSAVATATARDGAKFYYRMIPGSNAGRIVLIHSLAMDHRFWLPVAEWLSDAGDVLVYDCRGHGASDTSGAPFTVEQFADDLADLLNTVGWDDAVVAGASMGGTVAIAFAQRFSERTRGLGLIDTTAYYGEDAPVRWAERAQKAQDSGLSALVAFQKDRWFSADFAARRPEIADEAVAVFLANNVAAYAETCRMLGAADLRPGLSAMAMPTRIMVGSNDVATPPAMAAAMAAQIPNVQLDMLEGAAHLTPLECVDAVATMLRTLMEQTA